MSRPGARGGASSASALSRALALLARREHSRQELRSKLIARGFSDAEVDEALARLSENGLQSDERFVEALVRTRLQSGQGPARLRLELARHGLADLGDAALAEHAEHDGWHERALAFARKRFPAGVRSDRDAQRLAGQLLRRGHSSAVVRSVLAELGRQEYSEADADGAL